MHPNTSGRYQKKNAKNKIQKITDAASYRLKGVNSLLCPFPYRNAEDYGEDSATAHVRRLLDIVACTTSFGPSADKDSSAAAASAATKGGEEGKDGCGAQDGKISKKASKSPRAKSKKDNSPPPPADSEAKDGSAAAVDREGEMSNTSPKLGSFYEFFSLSHLTPPLQCNVSAFSDIVSLHLSTGITYTIT